MIEQGELQQLMGAAANGEQLLAKAVTTAQTAQSIVEADPDSAFVLAYDAARHALTAILAHQGLRPTTRGGHVVVERATKAQFGAGFRSFGALRRRRNELEYPQFPDDDATQDEAAEAVTAASRIVSDAEQLLPKLGLF